MNIVVMRLTFRALFGRRRALLFLALPALLFVVAGLTRWESHGNPATTAGLTGDFAMGTLLPLICLLVGTGAIGPEIEDASIVYLLAKPIPRRTIALSKLAVALATSLSLALASTMIAIAIAGDQGFELTAAYGVATALAAICYTSIFFMIAILSRNAIIVGLIYALLWETVLGGYVPGVRSLSVRQWALAPAAKIVKAHPDWGVTSAVSLTTAIVMLTLTTIVTIVVSVRRLRTLVVRAAE